MNDRGISELLGYSIMAGMVIVAVIAVTSGAAGVISSSAGELSLSEAVLSAQSLASIAMETARTNNTCFTASEVQAPPGYELLALDGPDDVVRLSVELDGGPVYAARTGSIRLQSAFRSVSFEGGAVFANDSGSVSIVRKPSVFMASHGGRKGLYIFLAGISADTGMISTGSHAILYLRTVAQQSESVSSPAPAPATISVSSRDPEGWADFLRGEGFAVTRDDSTVRATMGGVTDVHVTCTTLQVRPGQ